MDKRLVRDIMNAPPVSVGEETPVPEVARVMRDRDIGAVLVTRADGTLAGIISEADFSGMGRCVPFTLDLAPVVFGMRAADFEELKRIYSQARSLTARQIMHERVVTISPDTPIGEAVHLMVTKGFKHLPVVEGARPVGMLARHDVLKLLLPTD